MTTARRAWWILPALLGLLAAPGAVGAQPGAKMPLIGMLRPAAATDPADRANLAGFVAGLREAGYEPGRDVRLEVRYAEGRLDRFPALARELVAAGVEAIVTSSPYATRGALAASRAVPTVVALDYETDPVAAGWVASLARPGGSVTGMFLDQPAMSGKLLELLKEAAPGLTKLAVLWDEAIDQVQLDTTAQAARTAGLALAPVGVRRSADLAAAFRAAGRERADGLVVLTSPLLSVNRARIGDLALAHRLPGITLFTSFPAFGLLMAYGPDQPDAFRRAASQYVARILKGARPADLPVQRPEKFELVVNLKTARAFGLSLPPSVLTRADRVLE